MTRQPEESLQDARAHLALMWGMRDRIAHGYLLVDAEIVRRTLDHDIPPIVAAIEAELT